MFNFCDSEIVLLYYKNNPVKEVSLKPTKNQNILNKMT